jgi:alkanesulfonate monooxygenase
MSAHTSASEIFWFIPGAGDGRHLGAATRPNNFAYLASVAQAADTLGFDGVLLPTGGLSEDTIVVGSALLSLTRRLRFLVAVRPGLISPILAARINASLDRISNGRANLNVVSGSGRFDFEGLPLSHEERYELTREWLSVFRLLASSSWTETRDVAIWTMVGALVYAAGRWRVRQAVPKNP